MKIFDTPSQSYENKSKINWIPDVQSNLLQINRSSAPDQQLCIKKNQSVETVLLLLDLSYSSERNSLNRGENSEWNPQKTTYCLVQLF